MHSVFSYLISNLFLSEKNKRAGLAVLLISEVRVYILNTVYSVYTHTLKILLGFHVKIVGTSAR